MFNHSNFFLRVGCTVRRAGSSLTGGGGGYHKRSCEYKDQTFNPYISDVVCEAENK